jgi:hypothetical protein
MNRRCLTAVATAVSLIACSHTELVDATVPAVGPSGAGPDVRLTYNGNQDYWPIWTADGKGILYAFIPVGSNPEHRCIGLLPAAGGSAIWQLCDNRAVAQDSINSFPAYALGSDGQLLYVEAVSRVGPGSTAPSHVTLFLADTANPFKRQALLNLPTTVGTTPVSWLSDLAWTSPTTFVALAQDFTAALHCLGCSALDSIFPGAAVVRGTITATGATLQVVTGTDGATGYALAEGASSIAFTLRNDRRLFKVPAAGGAVTTAATVTAISSAELIGVSCKGSTCVVATDPVSLSAIDGGVGFPSTGPGPFELRGVSLATGVVQVLRATSSLVATPQISPVTGDVVAQVGGAFGHIQTITSSGSDLHLFLGLIQ